MEDRSERKITARLLNLALKTEWERVQQATQDV